MLLLVGCMLAFAVSEAQTTRRELWVWKDANGVTHYSDMPAPGAKRMEIVGSVPMSAAAAPASGGSSEGRSEGSGEGSGADRAGKPTATQYTSLEILSPESDASFFGADAVVDVSIGSEPRLALEDQLLLYLDGRPVEGSPNASSYTLSNLERGTHSLSAVILDAKGNQKIRSAPHSFTIQQTTVDNPRNVGPALKPKPTPLPAPGPTPTPPKSNK